MQGKMLEMLTFDREIEVNSSPSAFQVKSYLLGSLRRAFLIYGQTGTGKTSFIGKIAMKASKLTPFSELLDQLTLNIKETITNLISKVVFYWLKFVNGKIATKLKLIIS